MHQHISFQTTPSMSSSHPFTAVDDEDDTDICPVCDGRCTCRLELGINYQPTPPAPTTPSLKIKFTLPPSLIAKRQQPSVKVTHTTTPPRKRGRPPKHPVPPPETSTAKINKVRQNLRAAAISKRVVKRRRVAVQSDQDESYSSDTLETNYKHDEHSFPTFVSASVLSSLSSTSDSSSSSSPTSCSSDFESDADSNSVGGDNCHPKKRSPARDWVIRPRKTSVGGSDAEQMDVDTDDQVENQIDQDEDEDGDNEQEEEAPDGLHGVEEDDEDTDARHRYVGLATGWSEEDESSFDADLFFANLSDSSSTCSSSSTSTRRRCHSYTPGDIDADQSSSTSDSPTKTALPFEVTENWDGQLIFTNGLVGDAESRGIVDIDFEKDAERFIMDSDADDDSCSSYSGPDHDQLNRDLPSVAQGLESSDIDMFPISDVDAGYEEDGGEADEGDTTDEELVGDDSLPNERAMRLFTLPMPLSMGISTINPMSTIGGEKRRHRKGMDVHGDREERKRWRRRLRSAAGAGTSPRAADILAGKIVFWEDESRDGYASSSSNSMVKPSKGKGKQKLSFSPSSTSDVNHSRQLPNTPRSGLFVPTGETRQAVIGEDRKGIDVPSPHPRFYGRSSRVSVVQYLLKKHLQSQSQSPVVPPPAISTSTKSVSSPSIISDTPSPFHHLLSSSAASPLTGTEDFISTTPGGDEYDTGYSTPCPYPAKVEVNELTCIVELDDVLEASFLDDSIDRECEAGVGPSLAPASGVTLGGVQDSSRSPTTVTTTPPVDSTAAAEASNKHLRRWDVISIGAFRQTREQQQQAWGPGSSSAGDYGGVIKSGASASPLSALLWQNSGTSSNSTKVGVSAGPSKKTTSTTTSSSTLKTSTSRSSTKAAKRRRLMMASSTMSSPLVLPLSSTSLSTQPSKSHSSSLIPHSHSHSHSQPNPSTTHKTRKELRREKKLLKKKTTTSSPSSSIPQQQPSFFTTHPYAAHPNNANNNNNHHQFHTHQHHPNSKTRGQRMGCSGGVLPPLNL